LDLSFLGDARILRAFASDYPSARDRFRAAAAAAGWTTTTVELPGTAPDGTALAIDAAESGPTDPDRPVLVLSSGLHGVEGHFGSAVQVAVLEAIAEGTAWPAAVRGLFIHALNPFGFAWSRRCDDANRDINRAFRWPRMPVPGSDATYGEIDRLLNPQRRPSFNDFFTVRLLAQALRRGPAVLKRTIASGQRSFPKGLFFSGLDDPSLQGVLERELPRWIGDAADVLHLDLHTGLGRRAEASLIVDYVIDDETRAWWTGAFGSQILHEPLRDANAYTATGSLGQWCVNRGFAGRYRFAFAEFGTVSPARVLAALRAENQAHHWASPSDPIVRKAKARLRDVFCPADSAWRLRATRKALALIDSAARLPPEHWGPGRTDA
jgi:hypothetical protein